MTRVCPVPNCEVLLTTRLPLCTRHYSRVPAPVIKALDAAVKAGIEARDDVAKARAKAEYMAAWEMALAHASAVTAKNMGRTAGPGVEA